MPGDPFLSSSVWRRLRKLVFERDGGRCRECGKVVSGKASQVDHIQPRSKRPDLALDPENLQLLCIGCHNRKAARQDGRFGYPRPWTAACDADGNPTNARHPWHEDYKKKT